LHTININNNAKSSGIASPVREPSVLDNTDVGNSSSSVSHTGQSLIASNPSPAHRPTSQARSTTNSNTDVKDQSVPNRTDNEDPPVGLKQIRITNLEPYGLVEGRVDTATFPYYWNTDEDCGADSGNPSTSNVLKVVGLGF